MGSDILIPSNDLTIRASQIDHIYVDVLTLERDFMEAVVALGVNVGCGIFEKDSCNFVIKVQRMPADNFCTLHCDHGDLIISDYNILLDPDTGAVTGAPLLRRWLICVPRCSPQWPLGGPLTALPHD